MKKDLNRYKMYLKSKEWKVLRELALEVYGNQCGLCGNKNELTIHHKTYKRIFHENIADLMILCERCHQKQHRHKRKKVKDFNVITFYPKRTNKCTK